MSLRLIKAGILDTIQDLGRFGYQHLGINPGGAMDRPAAQIANLLVGNDINEAVIELHFPAAEFFFEQPALIAVSGADFSVNLNAEEIPRLQPVLVSKYSILQFYGLRAGARAYLAIHGGLNISKWLNSYSTNIKAAMGGYKGRALQKGDEISISCANGLTQVLGKKEFHVFPWKASLVEQHANEILVLPGNEWDELTGKSKQRLLEKPFVISNQSDRMGYRLQGKPLSMKTNEEMVSSAVCFGTVQLLPDGQLIVLMADHQTTGGYPRAMHVITAHHSRLAQMKAGDTLQFKMTDAATAGKLLKQQQQHLLQLQNACKFKLEEYLDK
jgi:antagonist of KipI